jgi:hypothetical protein
MKRKVSTLSGDQVGQSAIAATDIQHAGCSWEDFCEMPAEHFDPAWMDTPAMDCLEPSHLCFMPMMLMKKLERNV